MIQLSNNICKQSLGPYYNFLPKYSFQNTFTKVYPPIPIFPIIRKYSYTYLYGISIFMKIEKDSHLFDSQIIYKFLTLSKTLYKPIYKYQFVTVLFLYNASQSEFHIEIIPAFP